MRPLVVADLEYLCEPRPGPCVSLLLPTVRAGAETRQNPVRWRNLLRQAEDALGSWGEAGNEVLAPAWELADNETFWQHPADGLAAFAAPGVFGYFRLPFALDEHVEVAERFLVLPLLPFFRGDGRFFLLAFSAQQARLFEATRENVREVPLGASPRVTPQETAEIREEGHPELQRYCRELDQAVLAQLEDRAVPLVLAAVERLAALYREVTHHPNVLAEGPLGNPDHLDAAALQAAAWPFVAPVFTRRRERAVERFHRLAGTGRATTALAEALVAAAEGRVDVVFLPTDRTSLGVFDAGARGVSSGGAVENLFGRLALETLVHRGEVFPVKAAEVPGGGEIAAVLRGGSRT